MELFDYTSLVFSLTRAPTCFIASTTNVTVLLETVEICTICLLIRLARVFLLADPATGLRPRGGLVIFTTVPSGAVFDTPPAVLGESAEGTQMVISSSSSEMKAEEASLWRGWGVAFRPTSSLVA